MLFFVVNFISVCKDPYIFLALQGYKKTIDKDFKI